MEVPSRADIVIIGAGVMGASAAYHLAQRGWKNIVILEKDANFGQGATGRCAGGVRYQFATEINIKLSMASLPMMTRFKDEVGQEVNYRKCGYLFVLTDEKDLPQFQKQLKLQHHLGVETEWLSAEEVRSRLPGMQFEDAQAGTFNAQDGLVDPNSVVLGYITAAQRSGAKLLTNVEVVGINVVKNKVVGVETSAGYIETPLILNSAGPWSAHIGRMAGIEIPVQPIRRQMFTTGPLAEVSPDFPFTIDFAQSLYFHREGEGLLIGMSNPNELPGFNQVVDEDFELINFEAAVKRMPLIQNARRASHWAGLYEVTPDAHPIFGTSAVDGFMIVTGFSGHGFMHGPISGKLISELICDGAFQTVNVSALDLARFDEGRLIREYNVV
jgi:sarcosine oxidase, subunit beta